MPKIDPALLERKKLVFEHVRYTEDFKEVRFRLQPSKMSSYALATYLIFGGYQLGRNGATEVFKQEFMERISEYVEESTNPRIDPYSFREVIGNNIEGIVGMTFKAKFRDPNYQLTHRDLVKTRSEKETKAMIFSMRLRKIISMLSRSDKVVEVCKQYGLVKKALRDTELFSEIENLCLPQIYRFMAQRVKGLDSESQRQEGLLAIWSAAQSYEARNFARFTTLANTALKFKFSNLLRYSLATKRRANRNLINSGKIAHQDSIDCATIDNLILKEWERREGVLRTLDERFREVQDLGERAVLDSPPIHQILPSELNSDVLNLSRGCRRLHYKEGISLENFDQTSHVEKLVDPEGFPHFNEETVYLRPEDPFYFLDTPRKNLRELEDEQLQDQATKYADELEQKEFDLK